MTTDEDVEESTCRGAVKPHLAKKRLIKYNGLCGPCAYHLVTKLTYHGDMIPGSLVMVLFDQLEHLKWRLARAEDYAAHADEMIAALGDSL